MSPVLPPAYDDGDFGSLPYCQGELAGCRFLLVEDDEDTRFLYETLLLREGAEVVTVTDGEAAVTVALAQRFDAMILDLDLPIINGYEVCRELRRHGYQSPILAVTANALSTAKVACYSAGCDCYLTKPVPLIVLLKCLSLLVQLGLNQDERTRDLA